MELFKKPYNEYRRDFDYVGQWLDQCVTYAKLQNRDLDEAKFREYALAAISKDGPTPMFNPRMAMIIKDENNDRQRAQTTMYDYLKTIVVKDLKFAPTFTTYQPEHRKVSVEAAFLDIGMANRSIEKKNKFKAKERGDEAMATYHDLMQQKLKVLNNSSSGAKATAGTILYNQTGHSTLTSICRSTTSFSNSINEKLLGGFRHYYNVEVTVNNILAVLTWTDLNKVDAVLKQFNLKYLTPEETLMWIKRSTDLYWHAPIMFNQIEELVNKLTPLECSAYIYNSDLFALRYFNEEFVRTWMTDLLAGNQREPLPLEEAKAYCDLMDDDLAALVVIYVSHLCESNGKGTSVKTAMRERPEIIPQVGAAVKNTVEVFERYRDLIEVFLVSEIMPFESAHVPDMMRGVVLGSDTDSSLFALDHNWVSWYYGKVEHTEESRSLVATLVYITSQHIAHVLGMMTGILNIIDEKKPLIAMKNEFLFSSFTTTSRGKHYYAKKEAQEGIVIPSAAMETEVKGVGLKHTKVPHHITELFHDELNNVMNAIERDETISILDLRYRIAKLEHEIFQSIKLGEPQYLQRGQVKMKEAYKVENSLYKRGYEMWEAVFADKYGHTVEPPYDCIKVATSLDTRARFNTWLESFDDRVLAEKLRTWITEHNDGNPLGTFYVPQAVAASSGLPVELLKVMEPRKLVYTIVAPWYLLLESFNIYEFNKNITRLCSDDFPEFYIPEVIK